MDDFEFSHYEQCFDSKGWRWLKAWYVNVVTGEEYWVQAE